MTSMEEDPVSAYLSRVALLAENVNSSQLAELRSAVSAAISNYSTAQVKHVYLEAMLEVAANVWNASLALEDADPAIDATLKQASIDLQFSALENPKKLPVTHQLRLAEHAFKVAEIWGELDEWEAVDAALGRVLALSSALTAAAATENAAATITPTPHSIQERCALVHFNSLLLRLRACVRLGQELPANALLLKLKHATSQAASILLRQRTMFSLDLLATLVFEGENLLEISCYPKLTVQIMQHAYDAYTSLSSATPELQAVGMADDAQNLGARALILLCWAQITSGGASQFDATTLLGGGGGVNANEDISNNNDGNIPSSETILKSIHALQKHSARTADSVAVHFLAHQALQQAGRMQEAETELLTLVTHESVSAELCAEAIKSALLAPGGAESARAALAAAQDLTSTDDVSLIVELIEAVLSLSCSQTPSSSKGKSSTTAIAKATTATTADEVILELLEDESLKEALEKDHETMERILALCWNRACSLTEVDQPDWAIKFYTAALLFINPTSDTTIVNEIHMALALCYNALDEFEKAFEHLNACSSDGGIEISFAKYQTCLAAKDTDAAAAALRAIIAHPECNNDVLRVLCCESMDAGLPDAAKDALSALLDKLKCSSSSGEGGGSKESGNGDEGQQQRGSEKNQSVEYESLVFQNLIQLELDTLESKEQGPLEEQKESELEAVAKRPWDKLARVFELLVQRIDHVGGAAKFFSTDDGSWCQLEWMAGTAWNAGLDAEMSSGGGGGGGDTASLAAAAASLMKSCGYLCAAHSSPDDHLLSKQQFAFIVAAKEIINTAKDGVDAEPAVACLEKARSAARQRDGEDYAKNPTVLYIDILDFYLAVKQRNGEAATAVVERVKKNIPTAPAEPFLKMAAALEGENATTHPCAPARKIAIKAALERLTSQADLNYAAIAGVIRSLLELCSNDAGRLSTLQDAAALISATAAAPPTASTTAGTAGYPPLEARYLITAAWNRGATHSKFARMNDAEAFMGVALRILKAVASFNEQGEKQQPSNGSGGFSAEEKKMMFEEYARVQAATGTATEDVGGNSQEN